MYNHRKVSLILPTYREKDSIRQVICEFEALALVDEILVINNNANRRYIRGSPANLGSLPRQPTVDSEHKQPSWERVLSRPNIGNLHLPLVSASSS